MSPLPVSRPRQFDESDVLDAAVLCFWGRGLEGCSVRDLTSGTGLNAPSLYNAFGDKRGLFVKALEHYANHSMRPRIAQLTDHPEPIAALRSFFTDVVSRSLRDPRGCMIVNSVIEVASLDEELRNILNSYLAELRAAFRRSLTTARARGEIAVDPEETAELMLGLLLSIRVMARLRPARATLQSLVRSALLFLESGPARRGTRPRSSRHRLESTSTAIDRKLPPRAGRPARPVKRIEG